MKLDEFITKVLKDIDCGLENAKRDTDREYYVQSIGNEGVSFDIAVTTNSIQNTSTKGDVGAGIIEVLGAKVGASVDNAKERNEASRIKFTIFVPIQTKRQEEGQKMNKPDWTIDQ